VSTNSKQAATVATVAASTTSASLLTGAGRNAWFAVNATGAIAYLRFGSNAASSSDFSVSIAAGGYYECPQPVYAGPVQVILASGAGNIQVTSW
jgi:hypothetical protein